MRKFLKITGRTLLIILVILVIVVILIQTRPIKNLITDLIMANVNGRLQNAELSIQRIEMNYLSSLSLQGVSISQDGENILSLKEFRIHYSLKGIMSNRITISKILFDELNLALRQDAEGKWNLMTILPAVDKKEKPKNKPKNSNWEIVLDDFSLRNSEIKINSSRISDIMLHFAGKYSQDESYINLDKFSFNSHEPDLKLENLDFIARLENNKVMLDNMQIRTAENLITLGAEIDLDDLENGYIDINSDSLNLTEFSGFIQQEDIKMLPEIDIELTLKNQIANFNLKMNEADQKLNMKGTVNSVFGSPDYELRLAIEHLDGNHWLADAQYDSDINLNLTMKGKGIELEKAKMDFQLNVKPSYMGDRKVNEITLTGHKSGNSADFDTNIWGDFGKINISGAAKNIFDEVSYHLQGNLEGIDLAELVQNDTLHSDLNLGFEVTGKGRDPELLTADLKINGEHSTIMGMEINTLKADIHYEKGEYVIEDLQVVNPVAKLILNADGNVNGKHDLDFTLIVMDLQSMSKFVNAETLDGSGDIKGNIIINNKSYKANVTLSMKDLFYNEFSLGEMSGEIDLDSDLKNTIDTKLDLKDFKSGDLAIDSIALHSTGDEKQQQIELDVGAEKLIVHLESGVFIDSIITIELPVLNAEYDGLQVNSEHSNARILIGENYYQINDLQLAIGKGSLMIDGTITPTGTQQLSLDIQDFDLELLNSLGLLSSQIAGIFNLKAEVGGNISQPDISAEMQLTDLAWGDVQPGNIQINADLKEDKVDIVFILDKDKKTLISGSAKLPIYLNSENGEMIPSNEQLEADLLISDFDISLLKESFKQIKELNGLLGVDLHLRNNLSDPELNGNIKLERGNISIPQYGINYPEIRLKAAFQQRNLELEELYLAGSEGYLKFSGEAEVESPLSEGIKTIDMRLLADNFSLTDKRELQVKLNSDIKLTGSPEKLVYSGYLNIPKAIIDLDALPGGSKSKVDINSPLLVQASYKDIDQTVTSVKKKKKTQPDLIKNLTGEMKITIPRNTWIRNKDMNVEISGDLRVIKKSKYFEIYGTVSTLRGKYDLYGKKFDLKGGTVTFNGGSELNAMLDLKISHVFRDIYRNKRTLKLQITGDVNTPVINFYLDDEGISESDAISYLLFGKSNSEISQGEKSEVARQTESDLALSMLSKTIGNKLAEEIGKKLNLDVVEFSGGENWKQAAIVVGKYITNDLFINYKKEFSLDQSSEIVPDEVSLEYEMNKYISVQATRGDDKSTGVDVFWKFKLK